MHDSCVRGDEKKKKKGGRYDCKYLIYSDWQKYLVYFVKYLKICTIDLYKVKNKWTNVIEFVRVGENLNCTFCNDFSCLGTGIIMGLW